MLKTVAQALGRGLRQPEIYWPYPEPFGVVSLFKRLAHNTLRLFGYDLRRLPPKGDFPPFPEMTVDDFNMLRRVEELTVTSMANRWALVQAVRYLNAARIEGDIVECGVWRGGSSILAKLTHADADASMPRRFILFDTFAGMTKPEPVDVSCMTSESALREYNKGIRATHNAYVYAPLEKVVNNFKDLGVFDEDVIFHKGAVEDTLRNEANLPDRIALLRLDTDWYASTKVELEVLYPRLSIGGVLLIDDYGHWEGARKAVDEYFSNTPGFLVAVDYTCRLMVKR
jgi:O-methyltransferase